MEKPVYQYYDGRHDGCKLISRQISENEFVFINSYNKWNSTLPEGVEFPDETSWSIVIGYLNELNPPPEPEIIVEDEEI